MRFNNGRSEKMKRSSTVLVLIMVLCLGVSQAKAAWTITQLTNNTTDDGDPAISGMNVVWHGWDGNDQEIYSNFAGQITNNSTNEYNAAISGTNVVWQSRDGSDYSIQSNFAGQISDNTTTHD